jgi:hypothetical protein
MDLTQKILWLSALVIGVLAILLFRIQGRRGGWRYKKETLPQLGKVDAAYQHGKLVHYRLRKHGVLLEIMCGQPEAVSAGVERARALSKDDIDRHLQQALAAIPEAELKPWGFDKGSWQMESITIGSDGSMGFDLVNSGDRDHVCLVSLEDGRYTFEAVDG